MYLAGLAVEQKRSGLASGYFDGLVKVAADLRTASSDLIDKDVNRTADGKQTFAGTSEGKAALSRILKAYSVRNRVLGYCQSLSYVVEALMFALASETDIFWCLASICENLFPGYYVPTLAGYKADASVVESLLPKHAPRLAAMVAASDYPAPLDPILSDFLMCMTTTTFPTDTMLRVLDVTLFHGSAMLLAITVAFFRLHDAKLIHCDDILDAIELLREQAIRSYDPEQLIGETRALLKTVPMQKIKELQSAECKRRRSSAADKLSDRGVEWLEDFGGISDATAASLIAKFFENPQPLPPEYPPDYFSIPCAQFCEILSSAFSGEVSDGTLRSLFAAFGGDEPQGMCLQGFLSALVFLCGPEPDCSADEALELLFKCFDVDCTSALDRHEFGKLLTALTQVHSTPQDRAEASTEDGGTFGSQVFKFSRENKAASFAEFKASMQKNQRARQLLNAWVEGVAVGTTNFIAPRTPALI
mmetsp:Transcript_24890/g.64816  ORF Transcript_24890/g.64816 Transcript_24890/m.64816 type:complete len:476 (-) Transcript_24890:4112-5539(-)